MAWSSRRRKKTRKVVEPVAEQVEAPTSLLIIVEKEPEPPKPEECKQAHLYVYPPRRHRKVLALLNVVGNQFDEVRVR